MDPPLYFAANRIAWYPAEPEPKQHIGPDQLALAAMGLDWGLMEQVREGNGKPISDADSEPFYQLLEIAGRPEAESLWSKSQPIDLVRLLGKSEAHIGQIVTVRGICRRIIRVAVDDPDIRARHGLDHYYELDMFLPLGETSIRLGKDPTGEKNPVYYNTFPATLIARELPPGIEEGENLYEQLEAPAVFFKVWMFRSSYTDTYNKFQPAPMFITTVPKDVHELRPNHWVSNVIVGGSMGLAVLVLIGVYWWFQRADKKHRASIRSAIHRGDDQPDFKGLG
jgi:hypothetical protein